MKVRALLLDSIIFFILEQCLASSAIRDAQDVAVII